MHGFKLGRQPFYIFINVKSIGLVIGTVLMELFIENLSAIINNFDFINDRRRLHLNMNTQIVW